MIVANLDLEFLAQNFLIFLASMYIATASSTIFVAASLSIPTIFITFQVLLHEATN